jgi:hypothetical protein
MRRVSVPDLLEPCLLEPILAQLATMTTTSSGLEEVTRFRIANIIIFSIGQHPRSGNSDFVNQKTCLSLFFRRG